MRFNMGCGHNKRPGYVNVDAQAAAQPDQLWDLEEAPWPWPDGCAEEVLFIHSMEHMGGVPSVFLEIMRELYRICAPDASVVIHAPHPHHNDFISDPTHVRAITPEMLRLFDKAANDEWQALGAANSPLAHYTGVNFAIADTQMLLEKDYAAALREGKLTKEAVDAAVRSRLNVVREVRVTLRAVK